MKQQEQSMGAGGALAVQATNTDSAGEGEGSNGGPHAATERTPAEQSVVAAIQSGRSREALGLCARHHADAIGRLCMALVGSQAEAEDLTQETLLSAHDAFSSFRAEGSLRAWLLGIARRKCARHLERSALRESKLRLVRETEPQTGNDELVLMRQRASFARAALSEVRPSEREALLLRYVGDLTYREVAEACDIDEAAARKRVSRAVARLRAVLADKE
jgi:RNA polymerase sigma-70 factor (ECF subfamily)